MDQRGARGLVLSLCVLLFLCTYTHTISTNKTPHFLFNRNPIPINFVVNIALVGFNSDGGHNYFLSEASLENLLTQALANYSPSHLEKQRPLHLQYSFDYNIIKLSSNKLDELHQRLGLELRHIDKENEEHIDSYSIRADSTEWKQFFESLTVKSIPGEFTLIILNPDKRIIQSIRDNSSPPETEPSWNYLYSYGAGAAPSWIGDGRFAVIDIASGPASFGPSDVAEGAVTPITFPNLAYFKSLRPDLHVDKIAQIEAQLVTLIISAIQYVFVPDLKRTVVDADKILIPLIVLRNHNQFDPWSPDHEWSIDYDTISQAVQKMALPGQQITLVRDIHSLHEHKHLAIAVAKSSKIDSVHELNIFGQYFVRETQFLDSVILLDAIAESNDVIASGYIKKSENNPSQPPLPSHIVRNIYQSDTIPTTSNYTRPLGTRILPVYILSLTGEDDELLLDQTGLWAANNDAVVVLQTESDFVAVPYFKEADQVIVPPRDVSSEIVAGISVALGGLQYPTRKFSQQHKRLIDNYVWAHGHHPFGHFSKVVGLSQIYYDNMIRNSVISRVDLAFQVISEAVDKIDKFAKTYLYDPFGEDLQTRRNDETVDWLRFFNDAASDEPSSIITKEIVHRLYNEVERLESRFSLVTDRVQNHKLEDAYHISGSIMVGAGAFAEYVNQELKSLETKMLCCLLEHEPKARDDASEYGVTTTLIVLCVLIAVGFAVNYILLRKKSGKTRKIITQ